MIGNAAADMAKSAVNRMSVKRAAEHLGLSASTLNKMRSEGRGPRFLRLGSRVFYQRTDLDTYLQKAVVETTDSRAAA